MMTDLKVLTFNVWAIPISFMSKDVNIRLAEFAEALSKSDYDMVGVQELWSECDYEMIREKVKNVLPYSHYFISGLISSGCATFSKYPIIDTMCYKYVFNGYFWDVTHLDWYGGNAVTVCNIKHPRKNIIFANTQLHASYQYQGESSFKECRTLQAYQMIQYMKHCTRTDDAVIMLGDFNHEPHELGLLAIKQLTPFRDTYDIAKDKPSTCHTYDSTFNKDYISSVEPPQRIDYVFVNDYFECLSCNLAMQMIPGTNLHYSDHEGYEVKLKFHHECHQTAGNFDMESEKSQDMLNKLYRVMIDGREMSSKLPWMKIVPLVILFVVFILAPLMGLVELPGPGVWYGKLIFLFQLLLVLTCAVSLWTFTVVRSYEISYFRSIEDEIQVKLRTVQ